jgi:endogenous inhibitor of DNA gyrase (YacG/DUF329 family)
MTEPVTKTVSTAEAIARNGGERPSCDFCGRGQEWNQNRRSPQGGKWRCADETCPGRRARPVPVLVTVTCPECDVEFEAKQSAERRFCSPECFRADRAKKTAARREERLAVEREQRQQRQREREAARERRHQERRALHQRRANERLAKKTPASGLSEKPKLRTETSSEYALESQSDPVFAAVEVADFVEHYRRATGASIDRIATQIERYSSTLTGDGSPQRALYRIRSGECETVDLLTADAVVLGCGTFLPMTDLAAIADSMKLARQMVLTRAELDEETVSTAELERRASSLHRFSIGYLAGRQGIELEPEEAAA